MHDQCYKMSKSSKAIVILKNVEKLQFVILS